MSRNHLYLVAATATVAAAALAATPKFASIGLGTIKATQKTLDGYSFDVPSGAENEVPTIFVWSDNKVGYSRAEQGKIPLRFPVRVSQQCAGEYEQYQLPYVSIGDKLWPGGGGGAGKPILQKEGHVYPALLEVQLDKVQFAPGFSRAQAVQQCNLVIAGQAKDGKLPAGLLKEGFWIKTNGAVRASVKPGCVDKCDRIGFCEDFYAGSEPTTLPVWVHCMPTGYTEGHRLPPETHRTKPEAQRLPGLFRAIDLEAVNSPLRHECPATVVFRGKFQSNKPVKGSYRLVGSGGYASPSYPFSLADDGERSVSWQRRVELPAASGGALVAASEGSWPRKVEGWLQLEVDPDTPGEETRRSGRANYEVLCEKPPNPQATIKSNG